jgi:hypothetical protein
VVGCSLSAHCLSIAHSSDTCHIFWVGHNHNHIQCVIGVFGREITRYIGLARTMYIRCVYSILAGKSPNTRLYTVHYGVYVRFWPTHIDKIRCKCAVLATLTHCLCLTLTCRQAKKKNYFEHVTSMLWFSAAFSVV